MADTQISAYISEATKERVERYAEAHGVKKGPLVEQALLHHLQALRELPADVILPPRLVLSPASFDKVIARIEHPEEPTQAMRDLMSGTGAVGLPDVPLMDGPYVTNGLIVRLAP
jgi:hypothetical protein